ncbi:SDR family oxidoreductase [Allostreptomyces psammosilenae]|uniref:Gluconate 5-dehydrogenase n=1 Tax=Allostreptomyces psammosilenae TaxID=1892865 RepID=A0A853A1N2_9ACTN|nr:SDR family oxidoreductase [Allostreptomyces psammosilenae]NYI07360.1 gluconate 5-dehydrogenase [Allostreptomyces psammosilenae]
MSHPLFDVTGRTALVTGSSRGIGLALARGLVQAGCAVMLNGRDPERLAAAAGELAEAGPGPVHTVPFDVTDAGSVTAGVARAEELAGPIDILVNNAGAQLRAPLQDFSDGDWHRLLDTNLTSAFLVGREVARRMLPRGHGKIVNVCSLQSEVVRPGIAPYAATKGALKMLTKGMCADWGPHGIQVNGLGPGYIATELTAPLRADERFDAWVRGRTPAGRWGRTEDLVGALLFLVSPASDFVGGQVLYVDGGMTSVL